jgi:hypothetical protein
VPTEPAANPTHESATDPSVRAARRFAEAPDHEDDHRAAALLAPGCTYRIRGDELSGPGPIVASYKGNGDEAAERFDQIAYRSAVRPGHAGTATIEFADNISHAGRTLTHRCEQRISVDDAGRIARIEHIDLPGERERLCAFKAACGLGE